MKSLLTLCKNLFTFNTSCKQDCRQGRYCHCEPVSFYPAIKEVHNLSSKVTNTEISQELRNIANRLAQLGNQYHETQ